MPSVKVGIIGGSGLDDPDILKNRREKKVCTVFGTPSDALILGEIDRVECVLLARHGRKHDIMPGNINYRANIWALKMEGCTHILATTATGSLQEYIEPGDIVILDNFVDRTSNRKQTFHDGETNHPIGVCHLPMEPPFCKRTREVIIEVAEELGISVHKTGTVVAIEGPRFSTKAESMIYRSWACDVINMTSVPEVVLAKEAGICYASIALATDYDCWRETGEKVTVSDVLKIFKQNVTKVTYILTSAVSKIGQQNWDSTLCELADTVQSSVMLPH